MLQLHQRNAVQFRHSRDLPLRTKRSELDNKDEDLGSTLDGGIFQLQYFLGLITVVSQLNSIFGHFDRR